MIPLCPQTRKLFAPLHHNAIGKNDRMLLQLSDDGKHFIADIYQQLTDNSGKPWRAIARDGIRSVITDRMPEYKKLLASDHIEYQEPYRLGATDCTVELLATLLPSTAIHFADDETRELFDDIRLRSQVADHTATVIADYKLNRIVPPHNYEMSASFPLFDYQQLALVASKQQEGFLLWMKQGTGKTPIAIASICNGAVKYRQEGKPGFYKAIIVCPNNLRLNWYNEFCRFGTRPGRVTIINGTRMEREKQVVDAFMPGGEDDLYYTVLIVGYQTLFRTWETLQFVEWDEVIADEAHMICNPEAQQSKGMINLRDNSLHRLALTGTPVKNSPLDVYNILEWLGPCESGFADHSSFRKYYGTFDTAPTGHDILIGFQNLPILQERMARKSYYISLEEAQPDLPEKTYDVIEVPMTEIQDKAYKKLQTQLALEIEAEMSGGMHRQMMVTCILTKLLRLSQITSGFATWDKIVDPDNGDIVQPSYWEPLDDVNPKIEAVLDMLLTKQKHEKTIIWANWIPDIEYLKHVCDAHNIGSVVFRGLHKGYTDAMRAEAVRQFNEDRDIGVFIGTQGSGGTGLNLLGYPPGQGANYDTNCNHAIYVSQDWSHVKRDQSEFRNNRTGTRVPTRYTTILATHRNDHETIDHEIHSKLTGKRNTAIQVADLSDILSVILETKKFKRVLVA